MKQIFILIFLTFLSCGSEMSNPFDDDSDEGTNPDVSELGTPVVLTFLFETQIDSEEDDTLDFAIPFPDTYDVPLYVGSDGFISLLANEFPRMILRVCKTNSTSDNCTTEFDDIDFDIDIVLDSCGADVDDDECGSSDDTIYTGTLNSEGGISMNAIVIRIRLFAVTDEGDGTTADDTDTGLLVFSRLTARVTTGVVESGSLTESGSRINNRGVKLVGAGNIPNDIPTLGGAHYVSSLTGTFDIDPLALLE